MVATPSPLRPWIGDPHASSGGRPATQRQVFPHLQDFSTGCPVTGWLVLMGSETGVGCHGIHDCRVGSLVLDGIQGLFYEGGIAGVDFYWFSVEQGCDMCFGQVLLRIWGSGGRLIEHLVDWLTIEVISYMVGMYGLEILPDLVLGCILGRYVQVLCIAAVIECCLLF